jgi:cysteine synthase
VGGRRLRLTRMRNAWPGKPWCPEAGIEPARCCHRQILSLLRLPISPLRAAERAAQNYGTVNIHPYPTIEDAIGRTPLVALQRIDAADECEARQRGPRQARRQQPAGSVKDRPALSMIQRAEERGEIKPGDTLIEATSGNTGIALAMAAAIKGYRMVLIMPEDFSIERAQTMKAFGAELVLTPKSGGMEYARDLAEHMVARGQGPRARPVRQPRQPAHPLRDHRPRALGPTRMGASLTSSARWAPQAPSPACRTYLKEKNRAVRIVGAQPERRFAHPRHPQVAGGVPAQDLRAEHAWTSWST